MKRPLKQYVVAFYEAVKTPEVKIPDVLSNFIKLLHRDGVLSKAEKIFLLFRAYWNAVEREVDIAVTSAHPVVPSQQKHIGDAVQKTLGMEKYAVHVATEPALLGGVVIQYNDTILDGSVKRQLSGIKQALAE